MGIVGAGLAGYLLPPFLKKGVVPLIEDFIHQVGLKEYSMWVYLGVFLLLLLSIIPAIKTVFQKKVVNGGFVHIDEDNLKILKGRQKFLIPGEELRQLKFELKTATGKKAKLPGGSFLKIPTQKGTFLCEIDINNAEQRKDLENIVKVLKIKHEVAVELAEV